jgi:hypothetical protein
VNFSPGFFIVAGGGFIVLSLFIVNLVFAARRGRPSKYLTLALYGMAAIVVVFNFFRVLGTETIYVLAAHGVVLFSIGISLRRYFREEKEKEKT